MVTECSAPLEVFSCAGASREAVSDLYNLALRWLSPSGQQSAT